MYRNRHKQPSALGLLVLAQGWLLLNGCGDGTQFSENAINQGKSIENILVPGENENENENDTSAPGEADAVNNPANSIPDVLDKNRAGNSIAIEKGAVDFSLVETFSYGDDAEAQLVDYLFVLDNSCSMDEIRANVSSGFLSILNKNILPNRAKLGVMSTLIADENDYSRTHSDVAGYVNIEKEPGFLELVTAQSVDDYQALNNEYIGEWGLDACQDGWFDPDAKSAAGDYCLTAATQSTMSCLGAEAGLHALKQMITKKKAAGQKLFRDGAVANVIFVSDTHDPGTPSQNLIDTRPSFGDLNEALNDLQPTAGLRLHALAPTAVCTIEQMYDFSYYTAADASGGSKADSCATDDYQSFMESMVESSRKAVKAIFTLAKPASKILEVKVNGAARSDYTVIDQSTIAIPSLESNPASYSIEISYQL